MIERLARSAIGPVRLRAARKAAERGVHWAALRGAADDPYVLARLGLAGLALRYPARDAKARFGALLATGMRGDFDRLADVDRFDAGQRRLLAKALAPREPATAARILPDDDRTAICACQLASGDIDSIIGVCDGWKSREEAAISASCAVMAGNFGWARTAINEVMVQDGLAFVLDETIDDPFGIGDLQSMTRTQSDGPLVSVIVPFHENAETIAHALNSLMRQSWRNLEILTVDDRSPDRTADIVRNMAKTDSRLRLMTNMRAPGVYGARNTAIAAATGDFVTFLDADDWSPTERIARQVSAIVGGSTIAISNHIRMDESGAPVAPRVFPIVRPVPITMLLRRETLLRAGPFEEVSTGADSEMLGRLEMLHGKAAVHRDPAVLLVALWQGASLSRDAEGGMFGAEREAYRADWMFRHAGLEAPER